ncbi:MAG: anhydro-N-acetylmuramic acid kinase [candidate division Zixibacteria bacterium]|nr:anhydro-N-acetylmuramic acid kinase [candidate division Zixibacteria bacterium]
MTLADLLKKKTLVALGLNSGTSADGLDMTALTITKDKNQSVTYRLESGRSQAYPAKLRNEILAFSNEDAPQLSRQMYLDQTLGRFYGRTAVSFIRRLAKQGIIVDVIGSHGQTVRHLPQRAKYLGAVVNGTLQLGSLEQIAEQTGKVVCGDFRQADIALGNEGAPITVAAMNYLFSDRDESRLIVNIGGIANYFYFPAGSSAHKINAADSGPGNSLSDLLSLKLFNEKYDRSGRHASAGKVSVPLLNILKRHSFFRSKNISTGREEFGAELLKQALAYAKTHSLKKDDIIATLSELTVHGILASIKPLIAKDNNIKKLYLTGGGIRNKFFVRRLVQELPELTIEPIDNLGVPTQWVEAAAYAVMAERTVRSAPMPTNYSGGGRVKQMAVLGKIAQPPVSVVKAGIK